MTERKIETLFILIAITGFLMWNYPILSYLGLPSSGIFKLFCLFSSWIVLVYFTRKIVQKKSLEK